MHYRRIKQGCILRRSLFLQYISNSRRFGGKLCYHYRVHNIDINMQSIPVLLGMKVGTPTCAADRWDLYPSSDNVNQINHSAV